MTMIVSIESNNGIVLNRLHSEVQGVEREETFFEIKLLCLSFYDGAIKGHFIERHNSKGNGKMPCALMDMMRDIQFSIRWIVDMCSMLTGAVTESFPSLADVRTFAIGADKKINDVFGFTIHLLLNLERFTVFKLNGKTFNNVRTVTTKRIVTLSHSSLFLR